jgi:hypothetical protein
VALSSLNIADTASGAVITFQGHSDMTFLGIHKAQLSLVDFIV